MPSIPSVLITDMMGTQETPCLAIPHRVGLSVGFLDNTVICLIEAPGAVASQI